MNVSIFGKTAMAIGSVFALTLSASAAELGDPAAPLQIAEWAKGNPVDLSAAKGKQVVVVEFWATWCGPCRTSIPHLTEMAKKFASKDVLFVGVSDEPLKTVKPFVDKMGDKMDYTVAVDRDRLTSKGYMGAYKMNGIPHAFIVDKESRVVWHGHPMAGLDKALERIVAGTFDLAAEKKRSSAESKLNEFMAIAGKDPQDSRLGSLENELLMLDKEVDGGIYQGRKLDLGALRKQARFQTLAGEYRRALATGKSQSELEKIEQEAKPYAAEDFSFENLRSSFELNKVFSEYYRTARAGGSQAKLDEIGQKLAAMDTKNAEALNNIAWTILTDEGIKTRDVKFALKIAEAANKAAGGKKANILDTYARALYDNGRKAEAVEMQKRAIELCTDADQKEELLAALKKYQ